MHMQKLNLPQKNRHRLSPLPPLFWASSPQGEKSLQLCGHNRWNLVLKPQHCCAARPDRQKRWSHSFMLTSIQAVGQCRAPTLRACAQGQRSLHRAASPARAARARQQCPGPLSPRSPTTHGQRRSASWRSSRNRYRRPPAHHTWRRRCRCHRQPRCRRGSTPKRYPAIITSHVPALKQKR